MSQMEVRLKVPDYIVDLIERRGQVGQSDTERMALAIALAAENIKHGGGPFGSGIFDMDSGELIAPGVNLVVPESCSLYHGEITAIIFAQQAVGHFDLAAVGNFELVTSAEPCVQCYGAIPWSGVRRVVYGATREDVEAIGFDEGPKPANWIEALNSRNIEVIGPVLQDDAVAVLQDYRAGGHPIYNSES